MEVTETRAVTSYSPAKGVKSVKSSAKATDKAAVKSEKTDTSKLVDTFSREKEVTAEDTGIYSKETIAKAIESAEEQRTQAFTKMIQKMFESQGNSAQFTLSEINENIKLNFTEDDIEAAKKSVSDEGYYSVDAVATRIMDMATALGGNDPTKISVLRDAVIKGFGEAAKSLGLKDDDMPDISKKTYSEIMTRFDKWEESFKTDNSDAE